MAGFLFQKGLNRELLLPGVTLWFHVPSGGILPNLFCSETFDKIYCINILYLICCAESWNMAYSKSQILHSLKGKCK